MRKNLGWCNWLKQKLWSLITKNLLLGFTVVLNSRATRRTNLFWNDSRLDGALQPGTPHGGGVQQDGQDKREIGLDINIGNLTNKGSANEVGRMARSCDGSADGRQV